MTRFRQTLKTERFVRTTKSINQRVADGITVAIVQLRRLRVEKKQCPRHWKERSHSLPAARAALALQSPSVWQRTGANVAITYTKGADAAASVVKEIERAGRKAIAIQADATDARRHGAERRRLRESSLSGGTSCGAN